MSANDKAIRAACQYILNFLAVQIKRCLTKEKTGLMRQRLLVYPVFYSNRATKFIYANQERIISRYVVTNNNSNLETRLFSYGVTD